MYDVCGSSAPASPDATEQAYIRHYPTRRHAMRYVVASQCAVHIIIQCTHTPTSSSRTLTPQHRRLIMLHRNIRLPHNHHIVARTLAPASSAAARHPNRVLRTWPGRSARKTSQPGSRTQLEHFRAASMQLRARVVLQIYVFVPERLESWRSGHAGADAAVDY